MSQGQKMQKHIQGDRTKTDETTITKLGTGIVHHETSPTNEY